MTISHDIQAILTGVPVRDIVEAKWQGAITSRGYDGIYVLVDKHGHIFPKGSKLTGWSAGTIIDSGEAPKRPGDPGIVSSVMHDEPGYKMVSNMDTDEVGLEWVRDVTVPFFRKLELAIRKLNRQPGILSNWKKAVRLARDAGRSIRFQRGHNIEYWVTMVDDTFSKSKPDYPEDHPLRVGARGVRLRIRKVGGGDLEAGLASTCRPFYQGRGAGGARPPVFGDR
jgi:hypothetical protein